jgi:putative flippase GtrA
MNRIFSARLFRFGLVGITGMVIDFGITWICKEKIRINKYIANSAGFTCAVINNYLLNRYWTFAGTNSPIIHQFIIFLTVSLVGLGLNNLLMYLLVKNTKYNFYLLKLFVTGVVFVWNYGANLLYTFH